MNEILVGTRKGLFRIARGSDARWDVAGVDFIGIPVTLAIGDGEQRFAALDHGHFGCKIHRSRDAGRSWEERAAPAYPQEEDGASLSLIWSLEKAGTTLWAGTIPGGLFRSDDDGASWQLQRALWDRPERKQWLGGGYDAAGIHSICIHPTDPQRLLVGISCGGVWETRDCGESWAVRSSGMRAAYMPPDKANDPNIQDPHRVAQCRARPEVVWAQHHNGIFRSTDGAASWHEVSADPSSFGFAVAVHPRDGDTAWFVPAAKDECRVPVDGRLVVTRTRDGGRSFTSLHDGLPQAHAYDLVYRHGLDIDASGERLAMGSTTGGLWVSEDQGERWTQLGARLPPIYSVRFA